MKVPFDSVSEVVYDNNNTWLIFERGNSFMAKQKRAITSNDFMHLAVISDPQFSPDGSAVSFVQTKINKDKNYESHLFVQYPDEQNSKQWTFGNTKDSHPRYAPDGKNIVFQSTRSGLPQLWLMPTNGGEARQITTFKHGATSPNWSKDGKYIIFTASLEPDADVTKQVEQSKEERQEEQSEEAKKPIIIRDFKHKSDAGGFHDDKKSQLVLFDVEDETFTQLTTVKADHHFQDISPDGKTVLFAANLNNEADYELINDLYTIDLLTKKVSKITNGKGAYGNASYSPSGDKIACFGHEYAYQGATLSEIYIFDVQTLSRTCLSETWDMQLGDLMIGDTRLGQSHVGPTWSQNEKSLYFIATDHGATGLYEVTLESELNTCYKNNNHVFGFTYDRENDRIILGISSPTHPGDLFRLETDQTITSLTQTNKEFISEVALIDPEEVKITAEDGWEIQGWLMRPYGFETGKKYPFILEVHGGPHAMYGQTFFHEMQLLAAKGYVVLYTNPRGSHGYGQRFVDAVRTDYGGKDYTDLMTAVDHVIKQYSFIDTDRLGVTGGSYGGFITNWIVSHTNRFKAAVTQRCISNWLSFYGVSDIGYFFTKWELGTDLLEDPKKLWDFSPIKYAKDVDTPLLILHGEQDLRCPIEQGEQLFIALKQLRKEVEFVRFPGANHELSRSGDPTMKLERLNHICRWFEQYL